MEKLNKKNIKLDPQEIIKWTDEECAKNDKSFHIAAIDVRNILRELVAVYERLNLLDSILKKGEMTGYIIECPKCHVRYVVSTSDLNRGVNIRCQDCGEEYVQDQNIYGIDVINNINSGRKQ